MSSPTTTNIFFLGTFNLSNRCKVLHRIILATTNKGDAIFDPFLGTGTTAVVAKKLDRKYFGIERDKKYFKAAQQRIASAKKIEDDYLDTLENNKSKPRIPFGSLVELGILKPGTTLFDPKKKINAKIMVDGSIKYKESEGSIHKVAAKLSAVNITGDAASPLRNGMVAPQTIAGFTCYKTTALNSSGATDQVTISGLATDGNEHAVMAGHISSTATASHIAKTEVVRSTESFSDVVRGLHVFGRKVLRPESIVRGVIDFA